MIYLEKYPLYRYGVGVIVLDRQTNIDFKAVNIVIFTYKFIRTYIYNLLYNGVLNG